MLAKLLTLIFAPDSQGCAISLSDFHTKSLKAETPDNTGCLSF